MTLDTTVGTLFDEWARGPRSRITLRHLLNHTSGLDVDRAPFQEGGSIREHALSSELVFEPGHGFAYNNNAVDFLAAVFEEIGGVPLDEHLEEHVFRPLDIIDASWAKDADGTPRGAGELFIRPVDLAKLGQLMLDGGRWGGEEILPREWIETSSEQSQPFDAGCGLLWWREIDGRHELTEELLETWAAVGVAGQTIEDARSLVGRSFDGRDAYATALRSTVGTAAHRALTESLGELRIPTSTRSAKGDAVGHSARGWLGQFLVVIPEARLVAVRMRTPRPEDCEGGAGRDEYPQFPEDVRRLVVWERD